MFTIYYSDEDQYSQIKAETLSKYWFHYDEMVYNDYPGQWCRSLFDDDKEDNINLILDLDNGSSVLQTTKVCDDGINVIMDEEAFDNWQDGLAMYDHYVAMMGIVY